MAYDGLIEWLDYLPYFNAQHMQQLLGPSNYDMFRGDLIALRLIWDFASNIFPQNIPKITGVPYFIFLDYRGVHLEYFAETPIVPKGTRSFGGHQSARQHVRSATRPTKSRAQ